MKIIKKYLSTKPFWLLLINLALVVIWFNKGLIFAGGEGGIPFYNLSKSFELYFYTWRDALAGYPSLQDVGQAAFFYLLKAFQDLGVESYLLQAVSFYILMTIGTLSVYFLLKELLEDLPQKTKEKVALLASVFYLLNPYSMTQIWGRGLYTQFFFFAFLPSFLLFFSKGLKNKSIKYILLSALTSVLLATSFSHPANIISLWVVIFIYALFFVLTKKEKKERLFAIFLSLFFLGFWILVNSWWVLPYISLVSQTGGQSLGGTEHNVGSLMGVSRYNIPSVVIRLFHNYILVDKNYGEIYVSLAFVALSWLIPIISVFSLKVFKQLKAFKFFLFLFLISFFVVIGSNPPLGRLFVYLFKKFSFLQVYRNPYEKFGTVFLLAYSPFFAIGTIEISKRIRKFLKNKTSDSLINFLIVVLISGILVWPMWTGDFAGGFKINPWIKVPEYYRHADEWINNQNPDARIIKLPLNPGDGIRYNWEHPYQGVEPSDFIFRNPVIGRNIFVNKIFYNVLLERFGKLTPGAFGPDPDISKSEFRSEDFYKELEKLNVRYIVLHNDIDYELTGSRTPEEDRKYLAEQPNIKKVETFGELDIYEVDIDERVGRIYSPEVKLAYSKVNPALYKVDVKGASAPFNLYFLELFDTRWEAYIDGERIRNHERVFSYANSWSIDRGGDMEILIKYKPQDYARYGLKISLITVGFLIALGISSYILIRRKE